TAAPPKIKCNVGFDPCLLYQFHRPSLERRLERQAPGELQDALGLQGSNRGAGNLAKRIIVNVRVRIGELRVVEYIEGLHTKFDVHALGDRGGFGQSHVEVDAPRPAEEVSLGCAVGIAWIIDIRDRLERSGIEVIIAILFGVHDCNAVESGREIDIGEVAVARSRGSWIGGAEGVEQLRIDAERKPSPPAEDGVEAPSFHQALWSRGPGLIKRQIPSPTESDPLRNVEVGGAAELARFVIGHL